MIRSRLPVLFRFDLWLLAALTVLLTPAVIIDPFVAFFIGKGFSGRGLPFKLVLGFVLAIGLYLLFLLLLKLLKSHAHLLWPFTLALTVVGLSAYGRMGWWMRYMGDDFCVVEDFSRGWLTGVGWWYLNLSGRFGFHFLRGSTYFLPPELAQIHPFLQLFLFVLVLGAFFHRLFAVLGRPLSRFAAWAAAGMLSLIFLALIPNLFQSFLWLDGSLIYFSALTLLIFTLWVALGFLQRGGWARQVALSVLAVFSAGFNEPLTAALLSGTALALLFAGKKLWGNVKLRRTFFTLGGGWLLGGVLLVAAPGNFARADLLRVKPELTQVLMELWLRPAIFINEMLTTRTTLLLATLLVFFALGSLMFRPIFTRRSALLAFLFCAATFWASFVPLAVTSTGETRPLITPALLLLAALAVFGLAAGSRLKSDQFRRTAPALICFILAGLLLPLSWQAYRQIEPEFRAFAVQWDMRHADLLEQREQGVKIASTPITFQWRYGMADLRGRSWHWADRCMASYYGFEEIKLIQP